MKKAIIVGATSGIGKELARLLSKNGFLVGITGRRNALLVELKQEQPETFYTKQFDVTDTTLSILKLNELVEELGGLDLLIISSGTGELNENLDFEVEKRTIDTNVIGFTAIADWGFNYFRNQGFGHLAAISSIAGIRGMRQSPSYGSSKAFQINYLQALRQKVGNLQLPITITDIRPGFVNTDMAKGDGLFWVASVEKASRQILKALLKQKRLLYVTKRWGLIAWMLRRIPNFLYQKM
ncbi:MAG: SDR family NAD(P)-dependent oxidoreductase [Bacteroidia bacterium]|nr:SDR family NAD(P)-dependent oxidoreductase [Bacteroidia bacterium]